MPDGMPTASNVDDGCAPEFPAASLGFIGVGTIASAIVKGLCTCDTPPAKVYLSPRNAAKAKALADLFPGIVEVMPDSQAVLDACHWVFLSTKPGDDAMREIYTDLNFKEGHVVVCLVAGTATSTIKEVVAPATRVVQAFPLPPAEIHKSTTPMCPPDAGVEAMFSKLGKVIAVETPKEMMTIGMAGCLQGDYYKSMVTMHRFYVANGIDPEKAAQAISSYHDTFNTAALLAGADGFEHLVDEQTPGGMNERIIRELENGGNYANLTVAMKHLLPKLVGE